MYKVIDVEPGQCREVVWCLGYQVWRGGDGSFWGLWVRSDRWTTKFEWSTRNSIPAADQPTSGPATESRHCWQGDRWAKMRKHTSMDFSGMILTFIPLWVEQFVALVWFLVVVMFWAIEGLVSISPGECLAKWMWDSLVVSTHFAVTMLIRQSSASCWQQSHAWHGGNVALVAAMNTPTTFCNVNFVPKKWELNKMSDELSINKMKYAVI